jgi:protein CpxP
MAPEPLDLWGATMETNMKLFRPLALSASILILGACGAATAQPAPPPAPGHEMMGGMHEKGKGGMGHDPAAMAQRHADHLRAALQLTPAQEPALKAFLAEMRPPEGMGGKMDMGEPMKGMHKEMAGLTTPQRLDRMQDRMDKHRAMFDRHATAVKRFYAQLTPAQQKAFDAMPMMGHMDHGRRRGHGGMEHGKRG